ncbi:MAG: HD domain-containing protein [Candidatus Cyclonatronum sp.]|uniref:HD domain-containing protein n=1 Tax=Cyclonatronum sp. TaxID=3024185 RepID=UPI0025C4EEB1|nr:HD domain-containing protein [Cyclonatronum sp.]MCC5932742.1 HD domain-containing protein [Balneolales bacterium]MCH8486107.1 HD domain-containing protein [Cyclonatronum sp.]
MLSENKKDQLYKVFTDPIHGFVHVPKGQTLRLLDHPYVQRLRRIRQLGLAYTVFPGAEHSRFSHALGAVGLMLKMLTTLRDKNTTINNQEVEGVLAAILLHDIGHGPFSHTLEHTLVADFNHEMMTLALMKQLNAEFNGGLETAIQIFTDQYSKPFLHQLISSQLDADRLDYIKRDSFYTGVLEGSIGIDRIIKTLRVHNGSIVIEKKGIYAVENYIMARRFMYMQVYLHKTVLSADMLIRSVFRRAADLVTEGYQLNFPSQAIRYFLEQRPSAKKGISQELLQHYVMLDDADVLMCLKFWQHEKDPILADLCTRFLNRRFFRATALNNKLSPEDKHRYRLATSKILRSMRMPFDEKTAGYYFGTTETRNEAYRFERSGIYIMEQPGVAVEFSKAADARHIEALSHPIVKHYAIHLKELKS